jgi:Cytochrome P450
LVSAAIPYSRNPVKYLQTQANTYDDGLFTLDFFGTRITVVTNPKMMPQYHSALPTILSSPDAVADFGFLECLGFDNVYRATPIHRRLLLGSLTRSSTFPALMGTGIAHLQEAVPFCLQQTAESGSEVFDLTRRIALRSSIGFLGLDISCGLAQHYHKFQNDLEHAISLHIALPRLISQRYLADVARQRLELVNILASNIRSHFSALWPCTVEELRASKAPTYVDLLFAVELEQLGNQKPDSFDDIPADMFPRLAHFCISFLFAAHKNIAILSAQVIVFLQENPDALQRVSDELEHTVSDAKELSIDVLDNQCQYLGSCIGETLRLTSHTLGSMRRVNKPFSFVSPSDSKKRYHLPLGTYVAACHIVPSIDENVFEDAMQWKPERFDHTDSQGQSTLSRDKRNAYLPFSAGVCACPGRKLALHLSKALLIVLLQSTHLKVRDGSDHIPPLDFAKATLAQRSSPIIVDYSMIGHAM